MGYCDTCQSAGSVNRYGYCEICGTEHDSGGSMKMVTDMAAAAEPRSVYDFSSAS